VASGLLNQPGRKILRFEANPFAGDYPGIYGGEYCFVMRVDGNSQNYITLRTNGGDVVTAGERYRVMIDNKDLQDYSRDAVSFSANKAPGAFAYNTLIIPRKATDGKSMVVVRIRAYGRYWGYAQQGNFAGYQRAMEGDMPPIYDIYTSTDPVINLSDEVQGSLAQYASAASKAITQQLTDLKNTVSTTLANAIKNEVEGNDFKPAYANNNFNVVLAMGMAYQKGIYGTNSTDLAKKIRNAIDSMVYINYLVKQGADIKVSAKGQTATLQTAGAGWGGLFGGQGMGMYLLWKAGKITDLWLNKKVDLGIGNDTTTRRAQWIAAFKESLDYGLTKNGRRFITNQLMEASHSVYGACLALYALDNTTYHNAPKLGLRMMREALGLEVFTGVPANSTFDGSIKDADGYPTYQLGDSASTNTNLNFWGKDFHCTTAMGNGREQGYTCTSCYGNMGGRISDMYIATTYDPYIGTIVGGEGDKDILQVAVNNCKYQAYFTYPTVDADGYRGITSESPICWRNRYEPGKNYYGNLVVAALSGDEELMGHLLQAYKEGRFTIDTSYILYPYYTRSYYTTEALDKLIDFASSHDVDYTKMPSTDGEVDYVVGDPDDGIVAIKHGDNHLFVNFMSESNLLSSGAAHLITPTQTQRIWFVPDKIEYFHSGHTATLPNTYWNGNHKITYPDNPEMANGGMTYEYPAYDEEGNYNTNRPLCQYYQQLLGQYLVAENCSSSKSYNLEMTKAIDGKKAVDIATGQTVTLSSSILMKPGECKAYYLSDNNSQTIAKFDTVNSDVSALKTRVDTLIKFAQTASTALSDDEAPNTYKRSAFMPFFRELTMAAYIANSGTANQATVDSMATVLEDSYNTFVGTMPTFTGCVVPGTIDYTENISTTGSVNVSADAMKNAKSGSQVFIPISTSTSGDYIVKVKAKGHVADTYKPSLNVDVITAQEYYDGNAAVDTSRTQVISYSDFDYTTYLWLIHLDAGAQTVLRYVFGGTSSTYTVDVSKTVVDTVSAFDRLAVEITTATKLLNTYEGSGMVSDESCEALSEAIAQAGTVKSTDSYDTIQAAYNSLVAAEKVFKSNVLINEEHELNLETAIVSKQQYHSVLWPDGTLTKGIRANNWSKVYIGRYDLSKVKAIKVRTNIKSHYQYCYGLRAYAVPVEETSDSITTVDQLNALSNNDAYRIGTFYGDETIDGEPLKTGNTTWKVGPQYTFDMSSETLTVDSAGFVKDWGETAVAKTIGYTYTDENKTIVKDTYASEFNTNFTSTGLTDIWFQFGAEKWGEMVLDQVIVVTEENLEATPVHTISVSDAQPRKGIYDLLGRKLNQVTKSGIYIVDGRKIFIVR
jgi:hypothetical protein